MGIRFMYGSVSSSTKARMSHVGSIIVCRVAHTTIVIPSRMGNRCDDCVLSISTQNMAIADAAIRTNARLKGIPDSLVAASPSKREAFAASLDARLLNERGIMTRNGLYGGNYKLGRREWRKECAS